MGPFPHDAPQSRSLTKTPPAPMGSNLSNSPIPIRKSCAICSPMGFAHVAKHKTKAIELWQQGDVTYLLNAEPGSFAAGLSQNTGPVRPSMGWRVVDAQQAFDHAVSNGRRAI